MSARLLLAGMVAAMAVAGILLMAASCQADEVKLQWTAPCFEARLDSCASQSEVAETTLSHQRVTAVRFSDNDTLTLGDISQVGRECRADSADLEFAPGTMGVVMFRSFDIAGNRACRYASHVFAIEADSTWAPPPPPPPPPDSASGLAGAYFDNMDFTAPLGTRIDAQVDFDWNEGAPLPGMGVDRFSIRWTGFLRVAGAGTYQFRFRVESGVVMWVNAIQVINDPLSGEHSAVGSMSLIPGVYPLRIDYRAKDYSAMCRLFWTVPNGSEAVVPALAFSH